MPLSHGDPAPDFTIPSDGLEPWTLSDHIGQGKLVLLFFPGAFTSVCTSELNTVNNDLARYQDLGAEVIGISTDSPFVLSEFKKVNGLEFTLLSDHDGEVSALYGSKYDHDFTHLNLDRIAKRSAFVIGPDGTVRYAEVLENAGEQPDFEAITAVLERNA